MSLTCLVAATRNPAKVRQLAAISGDLAEVVPLPTEAGQDEPAEDGVSIAANATAKARFWSTRLDPHALMIATDGGLLIPGLGAHWDPTRTRRFAGSGATDRQRADELLQLASSLIGEQRAIGWQETLAIARGGMIIASWDAVDGPGLLAEQVDPALIAAGNGFWIPAVWRCPEFDGRLLAELSDQERASRHDHWSQLGEQLREFLRSYPAASKPVR